MVLDTSVLLHILFEEAGWEESAAFLMNQATRVVSAASVVEAQAVTAGRVASEPYSVLDALLRALDVTTVDLTVTQCDIARRAYLRYGKGSGHAARLNYGDVLSYALAKERGEPLAFSGEDFGRTDLEVVRLPVA